MAECRDSEVIIADILEAENTEVDQDEVVNVTQGLIDYDFDIGENITLSVDQLRTCDAEDDTTRPIDINSAPGPGPASGSGIRPRPDLGAASGDKSRKDTDVSIN